MEAHALTARMIHKQAQNPTQYLKGPSISNRIQFPFLVLLVSGGHTLLAIAHSVNEFSRLGSTLDDAVGEAFDKARTASSENKKYYQFSLGIANASTSLSQ